MGGGVVHLTGDALPRGTYFWQAVHGRLTSGIPAFENPSQANQSSTHSSTAFFLVVVQNQNQKQQQQQQQQQQFRALV